MTLLWAIVISTYFKVVIGLGILCIGLAFYCKWSEWRHVTITLCQHLNAAPKNEDPYSVLKRAAEESNLEFAQGDIFTEEGTQHVTFTINGTYFEVLLDTVWKPASFV